MKMIMIMIMGMERLGFQMRKKNPAFYNVTCWWFFHFLSISNRRLWPFVKVHFSLFSASCNLQSRVSGGTSFHREMSSNEILQLIDSSIIKNMKLKVHFSLFFCLLQSPIKSGGNFVEKDNVVKWNFTNDWQQHKKIYQN